MFCFVAQFLSYSYYPVINVYLFSWMESFPQFKDKDDVLHSY